jgi:hypothetical protein
MIYLGLSDFAVKREVFRSRTEPTSASHGKRFAAVVGPFRTMRGAEFMRDYGSMNPHCLCVADAERLAKVQS